MIEQLTHQQTLVSHCEQPGQEEPLNKDNSNGDGADEMIRLRMITELESQLQVKNEENLELAENYRRIKDEGDLKKRNSIAAGNDRS